MSNKVKIKALKSGNHYSLLKKKNCGISHKRDYQTCLMYYSHKIEIIKPI